MSKINDGGAAFPVAVPTEFQLAEGGMSLRDWFAGQALPALLTELYAQSVRNGVQFESVFDSAALASYDTADAMLSARSNRGEEDNG